MSALRALPARARSVVAGAAATIALLVMTQVLFPGAGESGRGTPAAILFSGLTFGMVNALVAAGIVLIYRTNRFINFAQAALGSAGAILAFRLMAFTPVPFLVAFVLGVLVAGGVGFIVEMVVIRRFFDSARLTLMVATIGVAFFLAGSLPVRLIEALPFIPDTRELSLDELAQLDPDLPLAGLSFHVGSFDVAFGFGHIFTIEVAVLTLVALAAFFRFTRAGVAVRAVADNPERAVLLGISVGRLSTITWIVTGMLAGTTAICTGVLRGPDAALGFNPELFLLSLAAAVLARMRSLPVATLASVLLTVGSQAFAFSYPDHAQLFQVAVLLVVIAALLLQRKELGRSERGGGAWQAVAEQRGIPAELARVGTVRVARGVLVAGTLAVAIGFPYLASVGFTATASTTYLMAIVTLSLVVLTGWAGQVSLAQGAFFGIGAALGGTLATDVGVPFWLALIVVPVVVGAVAMVVGLPALRIKGLFLAVTTLAFAFGVGAVMTTPATKELLLPGDAVEPPTFFLLDFDDNRSMYYLCLLALVLMIVMVRNLRRSRLGRVLIGLRENEANVQSFGISATRAKLTAFGISGAMAGFAGVLFAAQQQAVTPEPFAAFESTRVFIAAVLGGLGSPAGAVLGTAYFALTERFLNNAVIQAVVSQGGFLLVLVLLPGGLISGVNRVRDALLRIIAQRQQIVVPSLFADFDPDAHEHRLIPLAQPAPSSALGAMAARRYAMSSELYRGRGEDVAARLAEESSDHPAAAADPLALGAPVS